jgi:hypothetical protein
LQPDFFTVDKNKQHNRKNKRKIKQRRNEGNWVSDLIVLLSKGDISKYDDILWSVTPDAAEPFIKYQKKEVLFREAVLSFLGVKAHDDIVDDYCMTCQQAGLDIDCEHCSKDIKIEETLEKKTIGNK